MQDLEEEDKLEAIKGILETEGAEVSFNLPSCNETSSSPFPPSLPFASFALQESTIESSAASILEEYNRIQTIPPPAEPEAPDGPPTSAGSFLSQLVLSIHSASSRPRLR